LIAVDGPVRIVYSVRRDVARAVALTGLAIASRRIGNDRTIRHVVDAACACVTRTGLACRIGTALDRRIALDALSRGIAEGPTTRSACSIDSLGRMHRNAGAACVVGALVAVIRGHVSIVGDRLDRARAITLIDLAVSRGLTGHGRADSREVEAACSAITRTDLAFRIHTWTIAGHRALRRRDAIAIAIA